MTISPEIQTYLERLSELRAAMLKTLAGLDASALNWTPLPEETNSLLVLATHALGAEHGWFAEIIARGPKTRDRLAEFRAQGSDISALHARYTEAARASEQILSALTAADLETTREHPHFGTVTMRWIILHVIEHYAEHLGQMYLTRQLWEAKEDADPRRLHR
jgi:uncharacterized damage-inducible protein DinB